MRVFVLISLIFIFIFSSNLFAIERVEFKEEIPLSFASKVSDVAVDSLGNIYIVDPDKALVHVIDKKGNLKSSWGKDKEFNLKEPYGISIYKDIIYISDRGADSIHIFDKNGRHIDSFGRSGDAPKEFSSPMGICVDRDTIYVADTGNKRVQVFSLDGIYIGSYGESFLDRPVDVTVDYRGYVIVADKASLKVFTPAGKLDATYHTFKEPAVVKASSKGFYAGDNSTYQVKRFDLRGTPVLSFGSEGKGKAQFRNITGLEISQNGEVLITDGKKKTLQVFLPSSERAILESAPYMSSVKWAGEMTSKADSLLWDQAGGRLFALNRKANSITIIEGANTKALTPQKKNGWKNPGAIALDPDGNLWLADTGNDRVVRLSTDGSVVYSIGSSGSKMGYFSSPSDIAISENGTIYVADTENSRVQVFAKDGVFLRSFGDEKGDFRLEKPIALSLDRSGNIYVLDNEKGRVVIFDSEGRRKGFFGGKGTEKGKLLEPSDIIATATELYVLDSGNKRVQVFDLTGRYLRIFGSEGKGKGDFLSPTSFAIADNTKLYISDPKAERIQIISLTLTPKTPSELRAEGGMREVTLSWEPSGEDFIKNYKIYRSIDKISYTEVGTSEVPSFEDKVEPEKNYYYRVNAVAKDGNESALSTPTYVTALKYIPSRPAWISTNPGERLVALTWAPVQEDFVVGYAIYKEEAGEYKLIARTEKTGFVDRNLKPETAYSYKITAVSSDGVESDEIIAKVMTLKETKPPVEIEVTKVSNVFSNNYKQYEREPLMRVKIKNNTGDRITKLKVSFMIKEFMDYPSESEIENIQAGQSVEVPLTAVFNSKIIDITENTPVSALIKASYYENNALQSYSTSPTLMIYERHYVTWDVKPRIATFITPNDPIILEFAREIARQYSGQGVDPVIYARAVFNALGTMGLAYIPDPNSPYASRGVGTADYVQYPRETLLRKSGDCDDLVNLYSSLLESIGIETRLLDMPGHIIMMFSTGLDSSVIQSLDNLKDMFIIYEGYVWIPVETTVVGTSFMNAWKRAASIYSEKKDSIEVIDIKEAWKTFKPASLPASNWRAQNIYKDEIESRYGDDLKYLNDLRIRYISAKYLNRLYQNPSDTDAFLQIGIIYAESGDPRAEEFFNKVLEKEPKNPSALNNLGNIRFLEGRYEEALRYYKEASLVDPNDPHIWVNLARCYLKLGQKTNAKDAFERAYVLEPEVSHIYRNIAFEVGDPSLMLR